MRANPISIRALWENAWVFAVYGICIGLGIGSMAMFDLDLSKAEIVMMEPLSFYAFSALSLVGLVGLGLTNALGAPTAQAMYASAWVRKFWVPIANAGLATGAIVMGMMFGLGVGLSPWMASDPQIQRVVVLLLAMSAFVLALLVPLTWMKRSMFDLTKEEERKSVVVGVIYCLLVGFAFWQIDQEKFWYFIKVMIAASLFAGWLIRRLSRKRRAG